MLIIAFKTALRSQKARRTRPVTAIKDCDRFPEPWCFARKQPLKESISFPLLICTFLFFQDRLAVAESNGNNLLRKAHAFRYLIVYFHYTTVIPTCQLYVASFKIFFPSEHFFKFLYIIRHIIFFVRHVKCFIFMPYRQPYVCRFPGIF